LDIVKTDDDKPVEAVKENKITENIKDAGANVVNWG